MDICIDNTESFKFHSMTTWNARNRKIYLQIHRINHEKKMESVT